jgi:hypothetical protein
MSSETMRTILGAAFPEKHSNAALNMPDRKDRNLIMPLLYTRSNARCPDPFRSPGPAQTSISTYVEVRG